MKQTIREVMRLFRQLVLKSRRLTAFVKWIIYSHPRLKQMSIKILALDVVRLNPRSFDGLTSARIMNAMAKSHADKTNGDPVTFLQVTHE